MPTLKRPEGLVVDANPILSALIGGKARRVFFEAGIQEFAVPERVLTEVRAHLPALGLKHAIRVEFLDYSLTLLPLAVYASKTYRQSISEARRRVGDRDPDDVDVLALTLSLGYPLWSNDRDFEGTGVELFTTAQLLKVLYEQENEG